MDTSSRTLKQKAYLEMKEFLLIALYLWVVFLVLEVHKSVILAANHINIQSQGFAIVNALALAKVMLIARQLHFADFGKNTPLIYPTLMKAATYSLLLACFKILEDAAVGLYRGRSFSQSIADLGGGNWKAILSLTAIIFVVLIPFFAFAELQELLGEDKLQRIFLHDRGTLSLPQNEVGTAFHSMAQEKQEKEASA